MTRGGNSKFQRSRPGRDREMEGRRGRSRDTSHSFVSRTADQRVGQTENEVRKERGGGIAQEKQNDLCWDCKRGKKEEKNGSSLGEGDIECMRERSENIPRL